MDNGRKFKATVCVCSHNRPHFLREALQSLLDQTMQDFEIILIENSTDEPMKDDPSKNYLQEINKVVYWFTQRVEEDRFVLVNIPSRNWNTICPRWNMTLDLSRGEYFCTLDDDNKKLPEFLEKLSAVLDADPNIDVATCHNQTIDKDGNVTGLDPRPSIANKYNMRDQNFVDSGNALYRKDLFRRIGYWDENCITHEDWDFLIRAYWDGHGVQSIEEILAHYRLHGANRIYTSKDLGGEAHCAYVKNKIMPTLPYRVFIVTIGDSCTKSQKQVTNGIIRGIDSLEWVKIAGIVTQHEIPDTIDANLIITIGPFMIEEDKMLKLAATNIPICAIHMEDPQAHIRSSLSSRYAKWIVTNDESCLPHYRHLLGDPDRVLFCPALLANPYAFESETLPLNQRTYDVVLVGYPYESRKRFAKSLLGLEGLRVLFIGDTWDQVEWTKRTGWETLPTLSETTTYGYLGNSIIALLHHRESGDLNYGGFPPVSLQRGFLETYMGCVCLSDRAPTLFFPEDLMVGVTPYDLVSKINHILSNLEIFEPKAKEAQRICREKWTYPSRMQRLLNWIRSPRKWNLDSQLFNNAGTVRSKMPHDSPAWGVLEHPILGGGLFENCGTSQILIASQGNND